MITADSVKVPDSILVGLKPDTWVLQLLYTDQEAADWLAQGLETSDRRVVYRVRLDLIEALEYLPPKPAAVRPKPVRIVQANALPPVR